MEGRAPPIDGGKGERGRRRETGGAVTVMDSIRETEEKWPGPPALRGPQSPPRPHATPSWPTGQTGRLHPVTTGDTRSLRLCLTAVRCHFSRGKNSSFVFQKTTSPPRAQEKIRSPPAPNIRGGVLVAARRCVVQAALPIRPARPLPGKRLASSCPSPESSAGWLLPVR
jgi:hypothetical protein